MKFNKDSKILIVGLGVIGGGYASALTEKGYKVKCITKNQSDVDYAIERGMIEYGTTEVDAALIGESDIVIFALYPTVFIEWIREYQHLFKSGTLITDVTGVKVSVVDEIQNMLRDDVEFISAHPMAGRERSGVEYSDPNVFKGANYIITPTDRNSTEATEVCRLIGEELGFARISVLSPREHDEMIAFLSQLTHCIAVTLMTCNTNDGLEKYTGALLLPQSGFHHIYSGLYVHAGAVFQNYLRSLSSILPSQATERPSSPKYEGGIVRCRNSIRTNSLGRGGTDYGNKAKCRRRSKCRLRPRLPETCAKSPREERRVISFLQKHSTTIFPIIGS